ncbi:MAG TPA: hypothetical protein VK174_13505 [Chitinophagales bacterium]|nr:hypothetical protein [Chitinophagales bacterium]
MNKVIGVYETQQAAEQAALTLQQAGFAFETITIYNREDLTNNRIRIKISHRLEAVEMGVGVLISTIVGTLSGMGLFALPGFRFLYNQGAVRGALAGAIFGLIISFAIALAVSLIQYLTMVASNEKNLNEGKFLVFYDGHKRSDIKRAHEVLHTRDLPIELTTR